MAGRIGNHPLILLHCFTSTTTVVSVRIGVWPLIDCEKVMDRALHLMVTALMSV